MLFFQINDTKEWVPQQCCVQLEGGSNDDPKPKDFKKCQEAADKEDVTSEFLITKVIYRAVWPGCEAGWPLCVCLCAYL